MFAGLDSFGSLASNNRFRIPGNQRGFSWLPAHAKELLDDLEAAGDSHLYLGPVVLTGTGETVKDDGGVNLAEYLLEDGQQRLTTLFLLAKSLSVRLEQLLKNTKRSRQDEIASAHLLELFSFERGSKAVLRLGAQNDDTQAFLEHVFFGSARPKTQTPSMSRLAAVSESLHGFAAQLTKREVLSWRNRIASHARVVVVDLAKESLDRYLTFEGINSRGLPLSAFDKIKNYAMLLAKKRTLSIEPDELWFAAVTEFERYDVARRSDEADYVSDCMSLYRRARVDPAKCHDSFVSDFGSLRDSANKKIEKALKEFVSSWPDIATVFAYLCSSARKNEYGKRVSKSAGKWLDRIDNMGYPGICRILLIAGMLRFGKRDFEKLAKCVEIYLFRVHGIAARRIDNHKGPLAQLAASVMHDKMSANDAIARLQKLAAEKDATLDECISVLANGKPKYYHSEDVPGWKHCYYFLYEYEVHLAGRAASPKEWARDKKEKIAQQEHILPQSSPAWWRKHWEAHGVEDRRRSFVHRLGNLVLTDGNQSLGAKAFPKKLNAGRGKYSYSCAKSTCSEKRIADFSDGKTWLPENVLKRERDMILFAADRWRFPGEKKADLSALP